MLYFKKKYYSITPVSKRLLAQRHKESVSRTLSFGRRLMVFRGLRTRRTLRDLMVLMSLPLVPL